MSVCIIPARGGSTRIPRKNIREFHGKPIIAYSIEVAKQVFDHVIVSTDDDEIAQVALNYGAEAQKRDEAFARNEVGTQEVAKYVLRRMIEENGSDDWEDIDDTTLVCVLYATAPFIKTGDILSAMHKCVLRPCSYVICTSEHRLEDIGNFYIGRAREFLDKVNLCNDFTGVQVIKHAIDINTEDDWKKAEELYARLKSEEK